MFLPAQHDLSVRAGDQGHQRDTFSPGGGLGREWCATTATHPTQERPLGRDGQRGFNMMQRPEKCFNIGFGARFDAECPLSDGRDKDPLIQHVAPCRHETEPLEAGRG